MVKSKFSIHIALLALGINSVLGQTPHQNSISNQIKLVLQDTISKERIPGLIASIISSKDLIGIGSAGIRKVGSDEILTENDIVHLGSCTKAMTSMLIATLVADGQLTWETTIIAAIPQLKDKLHVDYHKVTLWQLLTHRGGILSNAKNWSAHSEVELKKRRIIILQENLSEPSKLKQGEYEYSNLGYMVAACMAESITGSTWEELMEKRIFTPLKMSSAGFGPPGMQRQTNQPWGHSKINQKWLPSQLDNAEALGPAGRVHCTMIDWANFISLFLSKNKSFSLEKSTLIKLLTPIGDYAGGWIVLKRSWAKGDVLTHSGSNTMWYTTVWVAPKLDRAYLVATNSYDNNSSNICDKIIGELLKIDQKN